MIELAEWIVSAVIVCLAVYFVGGYVFMIVGQPIYDLRKKQITPLTAILTVIGVGWFAVMLVIAFHLWAGMLSGHPVRY